LQIENNDCDNEFPEIIGDANLHFDKFNTFWIDETGELQIQLNYHLK
jgi:hypothetical protein